MTTPRREERVTPLELFFDLVFVFAITEVTGMVSADPTWGGLARALLVLGALWWAWTGYAWFTNTLDPDEGGVRLAMFAAMGAILVVSLAVPHAFGGDAGLFGVAYFVVRIMHIVLYASASRGDPDLFAAISRFARTATLGPALLIVASFFDGAGQAALWIAALLIDYGGVLIGGGEGWRVAPAHFAERHGLIVIIALGESIVSIGVGAAGLKLDAAVVTAALLGTAVVAALWWAYFDVVAIVAQRKLTEASGAARNRMARDSYSYLHLPMIAGIVLFAVALKKTLRHDGDPLGTIPAVSLCGGLALYLIAHLAFRLRNVGTLNRQRSVAALVLLALLPVALEVPALVSLAAVTVVWTVLITYEAIRFREARARVRGTQEAPA
jgi:low temperature requirement protein LtrA